MKNYNNNPDESELSDSSINNRTCFRVSVCLRRYFQDHRARCYMLLQRRRRVKWLERRIQKVFSITDAFCLRSDGHLLPSSEPLALLAPGDSIEVLPLNEDDRINNMSSNENIKGMKSISESTCLSLTNDSTLETCELTQNHPQDNDDVELSNQKVFNKNDSELYNGRCDINNSPLILETDCPNSINSFNKQIEVTKQNICDEADGSPDMLQKMKLQALMILDEESRPARRVRRRVRRRARPPAGSLADCPTSPQAMEVERNEADSPRLPRVIRPLD